VVNKDEWYTKEGWGKSVKMYSGMEKGPSRAEATSSSEKIKHVALAIVELRESEGIRQAGRQAGRQ